MTGYPLRAITGRQWRALRERHGITRREVCATLGLAVSTLRDIERGDQHPGPVVRARLARHYGVIGAEETYPRRNVA